MADTIFREKSLKRLSSPEQLNDYMKVTNPGVWMLLTGILLLLVGACIWGVMGRMETRINTVAVSEKGILSVYISDEDIGAVENGMLVRIDKEEYSIETVSREPEKADRLGEYALHLGGFSANDWLYVAAIDSDLPDGTYKASVIIERVAPMRIITN